jgi:hypothetical protein
MAEVPKLCNSPTTIDPLVAAMSRPVLVRVITENLKPLLARENRNKPCECGSGKLRAFCCGRKRKR